MYKQMLSLLLFSITLTSCQFGVTPSAVMLESISSRQLAGSGKVESVVNYDDRNIITIFLQSADVNFGEAVQIKHTGGENPQLIDVRVLLTESDTLVQRDYLIQSTETERLRDLHKALNQYTLSPGDLDLVTLLDQAKAILAAAL